MVYIIEIDHMMDVSQNRVIGNGASYYFQFTFLSWYITV